MMTMKSILMGLVFGITLLIITEPLLVYIFDKVVVVPRCFELLSYFAIGVLIGAIAGVVSGWVVTHG